MQLANILSILIYLQPFYTFYSWSIIKTSWRCCRCWPQLNSCSLRTFWVPILLCTFWISVFIFYASRLFFLLICTTFLSAFEATILKLCVRKSISKSDTRCLTFRISPHVLPIATELFSQGSLWRCPVSLMGC